MMAKMNYSNTIGRVLVDIHGLMGKFYKDFDENADYLKEKLSRRDQLQLVIYDQNEYRENKTSFTGKGTDVYSEADYYKKELRNTLLKYYNPVLVYGVYAHVDEYIQQIHAVFDSQDYDESPFDEKGNLIDSKEIVNRKFDRFMINVDNKNVLKDLLSGPFIHFQLKEDKLKEDFQREMKELIIGYFKSYNFAQNYTGHIVAAYKNNGKTIRSDKDQKYYNEHLVALSYVKKKEYELFSETDKELFKNSIGTGLSFFGDTFKNLILAKVPSAAKIVDQLDKTKKELVQSFRIHSEYGVTAVSYPPFVPQA